MKLYRNLNSFDSKGIQTAVTVGMFDSVHFGHQKVLKELTNISKLNKLESVVISFSNSTLSYFKQNVSDDFLFSIEDKIQQIEKLGIDHLIIIPFDDYVATIDAKHFVEDILITILNAKQLVLGYDNRFGKGREGSVDFVNKNFSTKIKAHSVEAEYLNYSNEIISSSLAKHYLTLGWVDKIDQLLGRHFYLKGIVQSGKKLGRQIGFPTANIFLSPQQFVPSVGVYATKVLLNGQIFKGVTNLGFRPTVENSKTLTIETYLFDFSEEIYGEEIEIEFIKMLRIEMKFNSIEELKIQISEDCEQAKKILA